MVICGAVGSGVSPLLLIATMGAAANPIKDYI